MAPRLSMRGLAEAVSRWHASRLSDVAYVLLGAFLINTAWVMKASLPLTGKIVEEGTGKPVPNAAVLVKWYGSNKGTWLPVIAFHHHVSPDCYHTEFARTDRNGHYRTSGWWEYGPLGAMVRLSSKYREVYVFGAGYEPLHKKEFNGRELTLQRFSGSADERLKNLKKAMNFGCSGARSERNEVPYLKALYAEMDRLDALDGIAQDQMLDYLAHSLQEIEPEASHYVVLRNAAKPKRRPVYRVIGAASSPIDAEGPVTEKSKP